MGLTLHFHKPSTNYLFALYLYLTSNINTIIITNMDTKDEDSAQQQSSPLLPISNHPPSSRPRTPILLKLETNLPLVTPAQPPETTPQETWDYPTSLRQLTALLLFTLQLLILITYHPSFLSLLPIPGPLSNHHCLLLADTIITCLAIIISSYVHFCIASLDCELLEQGWKPVYFYIMAADETVILLAAASSGLENVCSWGLFVVTVGSWYVGWRLGAVEVLSRRLFRAEGWEFGQGEGEEGRGLRVV